MPGVVQSVGTREVLFLDTRRVDQQQGQEIRRRARTVHRATKTVAHHPWQIPAVIEVRLAEDDGVEATLERGDRFPIPLA